jgi:hypothetical protein
MRIDTRLISICNWLLRQTWTKVPSTMKILILFVGWFILFVLCWPLALLALVLFPVLWLLLLPFRLIGITVGALFALLRAVLFLPARILGYGRCKCHA